MFKSVRTATLAVAIASAGAAGAGDLPQPQGRVLLTVSGAIENTNGDGVALFDAAMLRDLDWREIETYTSFTTGPQEFAGPTLQSLLDAVGARGQTMKAEAINGYFVKIPVAHAAEHDVLLAMEHNGRPMRVRDKGPIWVVYPLTEAETAAKPFDTEMIWQLTRIEIME